MAWPATPDALRGLLAGVDARAGVELDGDTVVYSYLDLRARFLLVLSASPAVTADVGGRVRAAFDADPDTSQVGVVAAASDDLATQMLAADDLADTITTPNGEPPARWEPALPVAAATRRMLEQRAPEWPPFDFDHGRLELLDLPSVVTGIARTIIAREAARSYRREAPGVQGARRARGRVRGPGRPGPRAGGPAGPRPRDRTHRPGGRMIRRLRIQGWRAFDDVTLELGEGLTFVVADNGVGKTSLVQAASWGLYGGLSQVDDPPPAGSGPRSPGSTWRWSCPTGAR